LGVEKNQEDLFTATLSSNKMVLTCGFEIKKEGFRFLWHVETAPQRRLPGRILAWRH